MSFVEDILRLTFVADTNLVSGTQKKFLIFIEIIGKLKVFLFMLSSRY